MAYTEASCQTVTASAWNDAKGLVRSEQTACDLIYRTVTANRHNDFFCRFASKNFRMSGIFSNHHPVSAAFDCRLDFRPSSFSGNRVYYK